MNKLLVLLVMVVSISACGKKDAVSSAAADLPKECSDYLTMVSACMSKQGGPTADALKSSMDQTKAAWASVGDKAALASSCKAINEAFAAQAAAMKC